MMIRKSLLLIIPLFLIISTCLLAQSLIDLPPHKFNAAQLGKKSQVRAVVKTKVYTQEQLSQTAVRLCEKYKKQSGGSFLVQFFSDPSCLKGWDGTGLLRPSDWPHWICKITVETNSHGRLHANSFQLAVDETTGKDRTDVLIK